jgi:hypothetical protein
MATMNSGTRRESTGVAGTVALPPMTPEAEAERAAITRWLRLRHSGKLVSQVWLAERIERGDHHPAASNMVGEHKERGDGE